MLQFFFEKQKRLNIGFQMKISTHILLLNGKPACRYINISNKIQPKINEQKDVLLASRSVTFKRSRLMLG